MPLSSTAQAIEDIRNGHFVIIVDDEDRENEGDLAIAAEFVTAESINFMTKYGRGLICMPMTAQRLEELKLPMMVSENTARYGTAFTVSVDATSGSTGISAQDRAATVHALLDPATKPEDLARPGHLFPLRVTEGGVLVRAGQTEAIVDLARMAGAVPRGCHLRDHGRRRHDGTAPGTGGDRGTSRPEHRQRGADHRLPARARADGGTSGRGPATDPLRGVHHGGLPL